jgi:sugar lactone lactonase YvrE
MKTFLFLLSFLLFHASQAQNFSVIVDSLHVPVGVETDAQGRIWITESGYGFNDGAVSVREPNGQIWPVVVGLTSLFDTVNQEGVGPWHTLALPGNRLAVTMGATGEVLVFDLTGFVPGVSAPLIASNAVWTLDIAGFVTSQGIAESDPYSVALGTDGNLYIADAAANAVIRAKPSGQLSVFAQFPGFPNPLPFGPPTVDAVPTKIINKPGGGFYICQLTGFPFLEGAASVYTLDSNGVVAQYATGLANLTDLALDASTGDLYALQIGHFVLDPMLPPGYAPNSAKVTRIKPNAEQEVVLENFDLSAGMALDGAGNLYTTQIGTGLLLKWENITTGIQEHVPVIDFSISPNPASEQVRVSFSLTAISNVQMRVIDAVGRAVFTQDLGRLNAGSHQTEWLSGAYAPGMYWVEIQTEQGRSAQALLKEE